MKIEWLITDAPAIGSSGQSGTFHGGDFGFACFWPVQDIFVVAEPLCDVGTPF